VAGDRLLKDLRSSDPERALQAARAVREELKEAEAVAVHSARRAGMSWQKIAELLGRTRSSVWELYSDDE